MNITLDSQRAHAFNRNLTDTITAKESCSSSDLNAHNHSFEELFKCKEDAYNINSAQILTAVISARVLLNNGNTPVETEIRMLPSSFFTKSQVDLDWCLFNISAELVLEMNNTLRNLDTDCCPVTGVTQSDNNDETEVVILSSEATPVLGILLLGKTFCVQSNSDAIEVWSVELLPGHCKLSTYYRIRC